MPVITHTLPLPVSMHPSNERKLRLVPRNLQAEQILHPHRHPWAQLTYAPEGILQVTADRQTWFVPPLRAIWIPPNVEHTVRILESARLRSLHIAPDCLALSGQHCLVLEVSALLRELVNKLEEIDAPGAREDHISAVILDELHHAETQPMHIAIPQDKRLKSLCERLLENPASDMTLEDFAKQVGASARTLARLFEQDLGLSFSQWRQQMRLARAMSLMLQDIPLSQVAAELGYTSQSAFSAMFKKAMGKSPTRFFHVD